NLSSYSSWASYPNEKLGMIPFSVSSLPTSWVQNAAQTIGWIYVTNDVLPNPWDSLPSYFGDLANVLDNGPTPPPNSHTLAVKSVDQNGNAINGMWMEVKQNGVTVKTGFTPLTVSLQQSTYTVSAANYQQIVFDHWSDGSKSSTISVNLSADSSLTAYYGNGVTTKPLSVSMQADKASAPAGSSIAFSANIQGGTAPYTWSVQFGDGTTSPFSSATTISKTYSSAGTFSAVATAKDSAGSTATSLPVTIVITPQSNTLSVKTVDLAGNPINGYYITLSQNGAQISSAFSPVSFTLNGGQTYQVAVSDYGSYFFDHWEDGSTSRTRTIVAGQTSAVTAYYSTGSKDVTLTVKSVNLAGSAINGMWTVIGGSDSKTGFTPMSYTATAANSYTVTVADYQSHIFDHWEDGSTSRTRTITPTSNTVVTAYYTQYTLLPRVAILFPFFIYHSFRNHCFLYDQHYRTRVQPSSSMNDFSKAGFARLLKFFENTDDIVKLTRAFGLATKAHKEQLVNKSEPYINHPLRVALIQAEELQIHDIELACAALLHDAYGNTIEQD